MEKVRENRETQIKTEHPKRVPLHEQARNRLTIDGLDKDRYEYRFINDIGSRIERFKNAGWEVDPSSREVGVADVKHTNVSLGTGTVANAGQGTKAVLMRIPKEYYNEDQKAKQREIDLAEQAMKRKLNSGNDGTYGSVEINKK